jgi:hypothetical protein
MNPFQIILSVLLTAALAYTVLGFRGKYGALSGRSRLYRTAGLGILVLLLTLSLFGTYINFYAGVSNAVGAIRQLCYWATCFVLAFSLPLIALLDALETFVAGRREKRAFLEQMIREEVEKAQAKKAQEQAQNSVSPTLTTPQTAPQTVQQDIGK